MTKGRTCLLIGVLAFSVLAPAVLIPRANSQEVCLFACVTAIIPSTSFAIVGQLVPVYVVVQQGFEVGGDAYDITLLANFLPIGEQQGTVSGTITLTFEWNTVGFAPGNYVLQANNFPVYGFVTLSGGKSPPTAVISPRLEFKMPVNGKVLFDGLQSFDNNSPAQQIVQYVFGINGVAVQSSSSPYYSFSPSMPDVYQICLVVVNGSGLSSQRDCNVVTVNPIKASPTAVIACATPVGPGVCPTKVDFKTTIIYDGTGSFDNNNPTQPVVRFVFSVNGPIAQDGSSAQFSFTPTAPGPYTVCLVVFNESQLPSSKVCKAVTVNAVKRNPTSVMNGPTTVMSGDTVVYDGSKSLDNSNPPQAILSYRWFNSVTGTSLGSGVSVKIQFNIPKGTYGLGLEVCDESLLCDTKTILITINPLPLTGDLDLPVAAYSTEFALFTVRVAGGSPPYDCTIDFGDNSTVILSPCTDGQPVFHTYYAAGAYNVTFSASGDNPGEAMGPMTKRLAVQPEPTFFQQKLSWKHHLSGSTQTFIASVVNPSNFTTTINVIVIVSRPDGTMSQAAGTFTLAAGENRTDLSFTYPTSLPGKYCFTAILQYQVDANGDGIIDVAGAGPNSKSGCFNKV